MDAKRQKYLNDYYKSHYENIHLCLPKGTKAIFKQKAEALGVSVTQLVLQAVKVYKGAGNNA